MIKWFISLLRRIVGRVKAIMMTNWFLTFGAMSLPIGFACFFIFYQVEDANIVFLISGWITGLFGLFSFFVAMVRSVYEDREKRSNEKQTKANYMAVMKTIEAIKGQMEGLRNDIRKTSERNTKSHK